MKNLVAGLSALALFAGSATAGGFSATVEEPIIVEVEESSSSSADLIVPLIFVALVAIAMSADSDDGGSDLNPL